MGLVVYIIFFFPYTAKWRRNDKRRYNLEKSEKNTYICVCVCINDTPVFIHANFRLQWK